MSFTIKGKYSEIKINATDIEQEAISQLYNMANSPVTEDCKVVVMPDVHAGKGATIGYTQTISKEHPRVIPSTVSVDIGCGMLVLKISKEAGDKIFNKQGLEKLDKVIHEKIPSGMKHRDKPLEKSKALKEELDSLICFSNES